MSALQPFASTGPLDKGDRVRLLKSPTTEGVVRFFGETEFADGLWMGIELDEPVGKTDGSVGGVRYFTCPPLYGLLVRPTAAAFVSRGRGAPENTLDSTRAPATVVEAAAANEFLDARQESEHNDPIVEASAQAEAIAAATANRAGAQSTADTVEAFEEQVTAKAETDNSRLELATSEKADTEEPTIGTVVENKTAEASPTGITVAQASAASVDGKGSGVPSVYASTVEASPATEDGSASHADVSTDLAESRIETTSAEATPDSVAVEALTSAVENSAEETQATARELLGRASEYLGIPLRVLMAAAGAVCAGFIWYGVGAELVYSFVVFPYPMYASFRALAQEPKKGYEMERWLKYWITFALLYTLESAVYRLLVTFNYHHLVRIAFMAWMQRPGFSGAEGVYTFVLRPLLGQYRSRIEKVLDRTCFELSGTLKGVGGNVMQEGQDRIVKKLALAALERS